MSDSVKLDWNANQPFYEHMRQCVWDKLAEYDNLLNITDGPEKRNVLENIHSTLRHWWNMTQIYAEPEEAENINGKFNEINTMTRGVEFSYWESTPEQNLKVRQILEKIRSELWLLIGRNGMLPTKRAYSASDAWRM